MTSPSIFNKHHARNYRNRAKNRNAPAADFLLTWAEKEITDRLSDITRKFDRALILSPSPGEEFLSILRTKVGSVIIKQNTLLSDEEIFPQDDSLFDLIIIFYDLHKINDLPGWLIQTRKALNEDGVFMACMAGEKTLQELRHSLLEAEIKISNGASPRIFPFPTKQQMAALLQRAGFTLPVVDSEKLSVLYRDPFHLISDLRDMGETNCLTDRNTIPPSYHLFATASEIYKNQFPDKETGNILATFEIIFLIGWSPSDTQQKPLPRGSGQIHLSSVLE